jgi:single-strand DNA-binding protein
MYLNSVQIIGFIGKDPERRQARANDAAFTVLSVATQRSWKNADDEWASKTEWHRVVAWNSLGERVAASLHQGDHVLVEGALVSSSYEREYGKGKKATTVKHTVWQIRADSIRKLNRGEKEPDTYLTNNEASSRTGGSQQDQQVRTRLTSCVSYPHLLLARGACPQASVVVGIFRLRPALKIRAPLNAPEFHFFL